MAARTVHFTSRNNSTYYILMLCTHFISLLMYIIYNISILFHLVKYAMCENDMLNAVIQLLGGLIAVHILKIIKCTSSGLQVTFN